MMLEYVTTQSFGMRNTWSGRSILNVLVPIAPVLLSPWAKLPHYFTKPVSHTSFRSGSFAKRLYDVTISPVFGCITGAEMFLRFSWEQIYSIGLVMESWLSFMMGNILSIPTAANENAIKASCLIIIGVRNDGLGVPCSTCYIWNMGSSTMVTRFGVVLAVVMSALRFKFFASSLFSCLVSLSFFEFLFLTLLWPPSESAIRGKNSLPPSVFSVGVGGWVGIIPGVLLRVTQACTLGVALMLERVVGVDEVCALFC